VDNGVYWACITSYDYDAPISEAGDYGQPGIGGPNKFEVRGHGQCSYSCRGANPVGTNPACASHALACISVSYSRAQQQRCVTHMSSNPGAHALCGSKVWLGS